MDYVLAFFSMRPREISDERLAKAREWFVRRGISLKSWADQHNVKTNVLYQVLEGKTLCTRGESHRIAVLLGLKEAVDGGLDCVPDPTPVAVINSDQRVKGTSASATRVAMPEVN